MPPDPSNATTTSSTVIPANAGPRRPVDARTGGDATRSSSGDGGDHARSLGPGVRRDDGAGADNVAHPFSGGARPVPTAEAVGRMRVAMGARPDGLVEQIAREAGVSPLDVLEAFGAAAAVILPGDRFEAVWESLSAWPEVLAIVQTGDIVLEVRGPLPRGSAGSGWLNLHGDSPIGGHLRLGATVRIALVDRAFHGRRSCSVWFMNGAGEAILKVFVPRAPDRSLLPAPLAAFEALRLAEAGPVAG